MTSNPNTKNKNTNYFTCTFQTETERKRTVCFSPTKRKLFTEVQNSCTPVKLSKINESNGDLVVHAWSKVSLLKSAPFEYDATILSDAFTTIAQLSRFAQYEFVNVKAEVSSLDDPIEIKGRNGEPLPKQELIIRDATSSCAVVLYGDYVGQLKLKQCYELKNLRLRKSGNHTYLNTSEAEKFSFNKIAPIENLVDTADNLSDVTLTGNVVGVSKIVQTYYCALCNKKATLKKDCVRCESCESDVNRKFSKSSWSLTLLFKEANNTYKLYFNHEMAAKLAEFLQFDLRDEEEIAQILYSGNLSEVKICFDKLNRNVKNVLEL